MYSESLLSTTCTMCAYTVHILVNYMVINIYLITHPLHALWHIRLAQDLARPLFFGLSLLLCPMSTQQSSIVRCHVVFGLFFCFLLASRLALFLLADRCSSSRHDQAMFTFSLQDEADVLLFCCLVESGVGDGLGPVHFQYLP